LVAAGEFAGIHLEGPFLSTAKPGAHEPSLLQTPDPASVDRLLEAGQGRIAMVTLAPELPGGLAAIQRLVDAGVVVAVGHTDADEQMIRRALDAGASVATHLFNAMRPIHHREPGPVPLLLDDDRVAVELICDGFHLHADVITLAVNAAGPDRVSLITDAMLAAGAADGDYLLGELPVRVADGMARLVRPDGQPGSIAGSTLTMARAFAFVVGAGIPIPAAAAMAATTPARRHGLNSVGELRVGARADLCVVDDHGVLSRVMQAGGWVSEPPVNQPS
jgi:N-acetylglucosamine-6-phosphate deacetylase